MAGQDDDHILQLINQNEERNRQAFNSSNNNNIINNQPPFSNNHHASPFSVAGRAISSLVDFDFRPSPVNIHPSSQINLSQTDGMFNPTTFSNHHPNHHHHHHHIKAASQVQPTMMQNNNHNNNPSNPNVSVAAAAAYHHNQIASMGHNAGQINHHGYTNVMNPNHHHHHQLLSGHTIPLHNSMAPQTSRLVGGGQVTSNQLSAVSSNLSVPTGTVPFLVQPNSFRPASSETTKRSTASKNGDSPRRTFACPTCAKGFTEKFNMKRHMQIHSQSRPKYTCNECSKSFAWKDNFIRHKKAAHENNSIEYQSV